MNSTGWTGFWEDQKQAFNTVMKISTTFFALRIEKLFGLKSGDEIFDYGCGPGFLSDCLTSKNIIVTGADINDFFLEQSRGRHPASLFIHITIDSNRNKKILDEQLKERKFDLIILLSIAQYFGSIAEVEKAIKLLLPYLKESGKIIVADVIDQNTSAFKDAFSLLLECIKKGKIIAYTRFVLYLIFSRYRKLSREVKLLELPEEVIRQISDTHLLQYKKLDRLTLHPSRANYILEKKFNGVF